MTKKMKSYRLSENTDNMIKYLAKAMGESEAEIITLAIDCLHFSGYVQTAIENKKRYGYNSTIRTLVEITQDPKI